MKTILKYIKILFAFFIKPKPQITNAKSARFINQDGKEFNTQYAIVPLISEDKETSEIFFIGTAFYISANGLLMTARHCLYNKNNEMFDNLGVYHFLPNNECILRPIRKGAISNDCDISYLLPETILDKNKQPVASSSLILTNHIPEYDDQLATYGYPKSRITHFENSESVVEFNSEFFLGKCREYHENGFGLLKNPCYQTTIEILSGSSGGPVFDKNGHVFAISSTGYDLADEGENISFVTPIFPSFDMTIEDGNGDIYTIKELIFRKFISFAL